MHPVKDRFQNFVLRSTMDRLGKKPRTPVLLFRQNQMQQSKLQFVRLVDEKLRRQSKTRI